MGQETYASLTAVVNHDERKGVSLSGRHLKNWTNICPAKSTRIRACASRIPHAKSKFCSRHVVRGVRTNLAPISPDRLPGTSPDLLKVMFTLMSQVKLT